jgi:uncharacterized protein YcbK (DUF882 family)
MCTDTTRSSARSKACKAAVVAALILAGARRGPAALGADGFDTKTAPFAIAFDGEVSAYRDWSAFVLPSARLTFQASGGPAGEYSMDAPGVPPVVATARVWRWTAPAEAGEYKLKFAIEMHVFVMVPAARTSGGALNGYTIGAYPPAKGNPLYQPPAGFVEVTKANEDTKVSPHFRLKQFLCKEDAANAYPKYVVIKPRLLLKLEAILERVNAAGFKADTFNVMSAYRTPYYNHAIGDVQYSMHQFGSAADIFVDTRAKGQMDDLNRDRRIDTNDSRYLYDLVERLLADPGYRKFQGGMGFYPANAAHPPFVHVDVRGTKARWKG